MIKLWNLFFYCTKINMDDGILERHRVMKKQTSKILQFCYYEKLQDKTAHSLCSIGKCSDSPTPPKNKKLLFFFCAGHGLNALLCHPGPKKTRAPFLPAGCPHTVDPVNAALSPPCGCPLPRTMATQSQRKDKNSLLNISRENTAPWQRAGGN